MGIRLTPAQKSALMEAFAGGSFNVYDEPGLGVNKRTAKALAKKGLVEPDGSGSGYNVPDLEMVAAALGYTVPDGDDASEALKQAIETVYDVDDVETYAGEDIGAFTHVDAGTHVDFSVCDAVARFKPRETYPELGCVTMLMNMAGFEGEASSLYEYVTF